MIDRQLIADVRFFELLDPEDRQELAKLLDELHLEAGARLFETGDQGEQLYLVLHEKMLEEFKKLRRSINSGRSGIHGSLR